MSINNAYNLLKDMQENKERITGASHRKDIGYEAVIFSTPSKHVMVTATAAGSKARRDSHEEPEIYSNYSISIASGTDRRELESLLHGEVEGIGIREIMRAKYVIADSHPQERMREIMDKVWGGVNDQEFDPPETTNELATMLLEYIPERSFFTPQRNKRIRNDILSGRHVR